MGPPPHNLPANVWGRIGPQLGHANLLALRATSSEARRGTNQEARKRSATKTAYQSATSIAVRSLVNGLKSEGVRAFLNGGRGTTIRSRWYKVGRYMLRVDRDIHNFTPRRRIAVYWLPPPWDGMQMEVRVALWDGTHAQHFVVGAPWVGGVTVNRLVKAAFKEAFGA